MSVTRLLAIQITSKSQVQKIRNFSKSFSFILLIFRVGMNEPPFTKLGGSPFVFGAYRLTRLVSSFVAYSSTAAWAAARRAIGTRNGEQLT